MSFNVCSEQRNLAVTLLQLLLFGVLCSGGWNVTYKKSHICAVKGSSVVIQCSFSYPSNENVKDVMWGHNTDFYNGPFISYNKNDSLKYKYIGGEVKNCSFQINKVENKDSGTYKFRFTTTSPSGKWTAKDGIKLEVNDLKVRIRKTNENRQIKEGDSVNLTCISSCNMGDFSPAFTWFKNGKLINEEPVLHFSNISSINSGNYCCSSTAHKGLTSAVKSINVEHGPKNTSGSVRPLTAVDPGSNITLTCSSVGNPPVENYTWFKISHGVMSVGNNHELHLNRVSADAAGKYFCTAANKHGSQNSSIITLKIRAYSPHNIFTRDVFIVSATVTVLLIVIIVIAVKRLNKDRTTAPETDCEDVNKNVVYINWPVFDNSQSQDGKDCEEVTERLIYTAVDFNRKQNMKQQMDSHNDDEGVVYSTVYRD